MVDEVDSASNNQVFLDFLAQLRMYYLNREEMSTFHSVILAGVYDIKNLKLKVRSNEEHQYNSPWNIAAYFDIDMDFSTKQIAGMLYEYESDHGTENYYIEAQTRDSKRTDVVVDYLGEQFVVELKIWHGDEYNERGEKQLAGYLDYFHLNQGYLLSFNFN